MSVPAIVSKSIPLHKKMWLPFLNMVGEKNEFRIVVTAPNYVHFKALCLVL